MPTDTCSQSGCSEPAAITYVWPGRAERMAACIKHALAVQNVASAMGFCLGVVQPVTAAKETDHA